VKRRNVDKKRKIERREKRRKKTENNKSVKKRKSLCVLPENVLNKTKTIRMNYKIYCDFSASFFFS
jgi:hypothetical protein